MNLLKYINNRVKICNSSKPTYLKIGLINTFGTAVQIAGSDIGVRIDGLKNTASAKGLFWFKEDDLELLYDKNNISEGNEMKNFKYVAVVRLLEDFNQKDYCFALYEEDYSLITSENTMVVVNARNKNRRILGIVKNIIPVEEYNGANITAQVVAVVNEDNYNARIAEEERLKDIAKKKADIERVCPPRKNRQ